MPRVKFLTWASIGALLLFLSTLISSCSSPKPTPAESGIVPTPDLWGEMKPSVSVKELMRDMIDPLADYVFDAVGIDITKNGTVERVPKTQEDWDRVRMGGVSIAEAAYLLKVRRPFAPAGDVNNSTGPDAVELSPAAIMAKVQKDPVEWNARIEALRNVGREVIDVANRKDVNELWDAAENLDEACENCHRSYWYPGENAQFYDKLNRRLEEYVKRMSPSARPAKPTK